MSWAGDSRLVVVGRERDGVRQMRYVQVDGSPPPAQAPAAPSGVQDIAASEDDGCRWSPTRRTTASCGCPPERSGEKVVTERVVAGLSGVSPTPAGRGGLAEDARPGTVRVSRSAGSASRAPLSGGTALAFAGSVGLSVAGAFRWKRRGDSGVFHRAFSTGVVRVRRPRHSGRMRALVAGPDRPGGAGRVRRLRQAPHGALRRMQRRPEGAGPGRVRPSRGAAGLPVVHASARYADQVRAVLLAHKERGALGLAAAGAVLARAVDAPRVRRDLARAPSGGSSGGRLRGAGARRRARSVRSAGGTGAGARPGAADRARRGGAQRRGRAGTDAAGAAPAAEGGRPVGAQRRGADGESCGSVGDGARRRTAAGPGAGSSWWTM